MLLIINKIVGKFFRRSLIHFFKPQRGGVKFIISRGRAVLNLLVAFIALRLKLIKLMLFANSFLKKFKIYYKNWYFFISLKRRICNTVLKAAFMLNNKKLTIAFAF
ncbi:hypothetical protein GGTG_11539 [Gaeumannomyces tritici R3-111a-1]|uniref:Uncharacterized protein n=1 Tax=Gaeumannomyces tritici (strain R3-111a-1) TaxID=644352 RepID=J3PDG8_GAET3|nr:hypothetical protein GGTG_11539 [Gaeumannomyces tritici R3-111a-1]EJT70516.1 hypothetical protein GGTG_11539 [Gaeumannomyces tritici R3-111a-1]